MDERLAGLQAQVKKLLTQKDKLIKELNAVEERYENQDRLFRRYLPPVIDTMAQGDTPFAKACRQLSIALRKKAGDTKLVYIFEQLKTAMIQEDIGPAQPQKKGLFSGFLKSSHGTGVGEAKESYHEVINRLRSILDSKYTDRLNTLAGKILGASEAGDIAEIRESVFSLVFTYISDTNLDREKVNAFVLEIVGKILTIETRLAASYEQTHSMASSNKGFEKALSSEMADLQQSSDVAVNLDDLKVQVSRRLSSIEKALQKKQAVDAAIHKLAEKNRTAFKSGFAKLKMELKEATRYSEELEKKLNQDQLTGAFNRRAYDRKIMEEMNRFLRYGSVFSLMIIDADHFKRVNDQYGHAVGDRCLKEIIKRTTPLLRKNDMLARYGGEEFVVIMPETPAQGAVQAAEKIRQTIERIEFIYKEKIVRVTVSIGISSARQGDTQHQQIFERADIAVYKAKENGRNQVIQQ